LKQIAVQFPDQTGCHPKETLAKLFKAAKVIKFYDFVIWNQDTIKLSISLSI
jgi:hypothetical protein